MEALGPPLREIWNFSGCFCFLKDFDSDEAGDDDGGGDAVNIYFGCFPRCCLCFPSSIRLRADTTLESIHCCSLFSLPLPMSASSSEAS